MTAVIVLAAAAAATVAMLAVTARHAWINRPPVMWDPNTGYYRAARLLIKEHHGGYGPRRPRRHS